MEKDPITPSPGIIFTEEGFFDLDKVYSKIIPFLEEKEYEVHEKKHKTRMKKKGEETEITVEGTRDINDFIQFWVQINIRTRALQPNKEGRLLMTFHAALNLDYLNKWGHKKLKAFMFENYQKRVKKLEIINYENKLAAELKELINQIKESLDFYK